MVPAHGNTKDQSQKMQVSEPYSAADGTLGESKLDTDWLQLTLEAIRAFPDIKPDNQSLIDSVKKLSADQATTCFSKSVGRAIELFCLDNVAEGAFLVSFAGFCVRHVQRSSKSAMPLNAEHINLAEQLSRECHACFERVACKNVGNTITPANMADLQDLARTVKFAWQIITGKVEDATFNNCLYLRTPQRSEM